MTAIAPADHAAYLDWLKAKLDQAIILLDDDAWRDATAHDSITTYRAYLSSFPEGRHVNDAKQSIEALTSDSLVRIFEGTIGHAGTIRGLAFSPDGRRFISSDRLRLILWDAATGEMLRTFRCHYNHIYDHHTIAISPDGRHVLHSGGRCDLETGETICTFDNVVAFSPDGQWGVSAVAGRCLTLCDTNTGESIRSLGDYIELDTELDEYFVTAAFAPNGITLAIIYGNKKIALLNISSGETKCIWDNSDGSRSLPRMIEFSPDGRLLLLGEYLWDIDAGTFLTVSVGYSRAAAFTPNGKQLLTAPCVFGRQQPIHFWDIDSLAINRTLDFDRNTYCDALALSPDGAHLILAEGLTVRLYNVISGEETQVFESAVRGHSDEVLGVTITPYEDEALSVGADGTINRWMIGSGELNRTIRIRGRYSFADFAPGARYALAKSDRVSTLVVWDLETSKQKHDIFMGEDMPHQGALCPDGRRFLLRTCWDEAEPLQLWDLETCRSVRFLDGPFVDLACTAISPSGKLAASASRNGSLRVWDIDSGKAVWVNDQTPSSVFDPDGEYSMLMWVGFTPDGRQMIVPSSAGLCFWNIETGQRSCANDHPLNSDALSCISFSHDARHAVAGTRSGQVMLVDMTTANLMRTFEGHFGTVTCVDISRKGHYIISGGDDTTVRIWDLSRPSNGTDFHDIAWQRTKAQNTLSAYDHYQRYHRDSQHSDEAFQGFRRLEADRVAWLKARRTNRIADLESYLAAQQKGQYRSQARDRIAELIDELLQQDKTAWESAAQENSIASFETYLKMQADGKFRVEARGMIDQLIQTDEQAWENARKGGSLLAYQDYLRAIPGALHRAEAIQTIGVLEADSSAWQGAEARDTREAYRVYLDAQPDGRYRDQAHAAMEAIEAADDSVWGRARRMFKDIRGK